jgi:serine protease Do
MPAVRNARSLTMSRDAQNQRSRRLKALITGALLGATALLALAAYRPAHAETAAGPMPGAPLTFADIVDKVKGSVVSIYITGKGDGAETAGDKPNNFPDLPDDNPLNQFFKKFKKNDKGGDGPSQDLKAQGSGFVISEDGYVVTNNHVIEGANKIEVSFDENERIEATLIGADPRTDLALIKLSGDKKLTALKFATKPVRVGDWVIAIGNPFGLGGTVTAGIVSARSRDINSGPYDFIQIDASVNKGNSGGPSFNLDGDVIGVNSAIYSPSGGSVGIAFDIPAELVQRVVADLKTSGSVSRGWLGVHIQNVSADIASSIGLKDAHGALITKITEKGPADGSELKVGDAVLSVNGKRVDDSRGLARMIADLAPKAVTALSVFRDGKERDVSITLGQFPDEKKLASLETQTPPKAESSKMIPETKDLGELGLSLAPASVLGKDDVSGVLVTKVAKGSEAEDKGLKEGDIILEVGGNKVASPSDVLQGVDEAKKQGRKAVLMHLKQGDQDQFVPLKLAKG